MICKQQDAHQNNVENIVLILKLLTLIQLRHELVIFQKMISAHRFTGCSIAVRRNLLVWKKTINWIFTAIFTVEIPISTDLV